MPTCFTYVEVTVTVIIRTTYIHCTATPYYTHTMRLCILMCNIILQTGRARVRSEILCESSGKLHRNASPLRRTTTAHIYTFAFSPNIMMHSIQTHTATGCRLYTIHAIATQAYMLACIRALCICGARRCLWLALVGKVRVRASERVQERTGRMRVRARPKHKVKSMCDKITLCTRYTNGRPVCMYFRLLTVERT